MYLLINFALLWSYKIRFSHEKLIIKLMLLCAFQDLTLIYYLRLRLNNKLNLYVIAYTCMTGRVEQRSSCHGMLDLHVVVT